MDIVNLLASLISGVTGGNMAGAALKDQGLGTNSVFGLIGGGRWHDPATTWCHCRPGQRCARCRVSDRQHRDLQRRRRFHGARDRAYQGCDARWMILRNT
jgi:hypothetical protein